jgi:hypothetical protein
MLFAGKWMELEDTMLSKISQGQKNKCHVFRHIWNVDLNNNNNMT